MSDIEKRDLEAHVVLCAERYKNLEEKLDNLENRTSSIERTVVEIREKLIEIASDTHKTALVSAEATTGKVVKYAAVIIGVLVSMLIGIIAYDFQRIDNAIEKTKQIETEQKR